MKSDPQTEGLSTSKPIHSFESFSELKCQTLPMKAGKNTFDVLVGSNNDRINLPTGESPILTYCLPETGVHQITLFSRIIHEEKKGKEEVFFPEVSLLDQEGHVVRTISNDQIKYQPPKLITEEGVSATFMINNNTPNPARSMVIYTSDEVRKGSTKLVNEAKAYAKARGTVPLPYPDTYAKHGNNGQLTITLKSSTGLTQPDFIPASVLISAAPAELPKADPFTQKLTLHYRKVVSDSLKAGNVSQALDRRSELKSVVNATEAYFASHYQQKQDGVRPADMIKADESITVQAVQHYQEKITQYLKKGEGALALKVVDEVRTVQDKTDKLFDKKF